MYCTNCGKELPENSKFCNHCGSAQGVEVQSGHSEVAESKKTKEPKKKPGWLAISVFLISVFVVIMCFNGINDENKAENRGSADESVISTTAEPPVEISAEKLIKAYVDNEVKADTLYDGKTVIINGKVDRIDQTDYVLSENEFVVYVGTGDSIENCLRCYISEEQREIVAELERGDEITVTGKCVGVGSPHFNLKCVNIYHGEIAE